MTLPQSTTTRDGARLRCPWCGSYDVEQATVTFEDLRSAYEDHALMRVAVSKDGLAEAQALKGDCPACAKPFVVKLSSYTCREFTEDFVRLMPMRTEQDFRLLSMQVGEPET